jgi:hypothetical protein
MWHDLHAFAANERLKCYCDSSGLQNRLRGADDASCGKGRGAYCQLLAEHKARPEGEAASADLAQRRLAGPGSG